MPLCARALSVAFDMQTPKDTTQARPIIGRGEVVHVNGIPVKVLTPFEYESATCLKGNEQEAPTQSLP